MKCNLTDTDTDTDTNTDTDTDIDTDTDTHQFVCNGHCYQQWYLRDTDT